MGATGTAPWRLEVHLFLSEKRGGKSHFGVFLVSVVLGIRRYCIASRSLLPIIFMHYIHTKQDHREPVLLVVLKIMLSAKFSLLVIIFLICVYLHLERICRVLSSWGQRGQVRFQVNECLNHTACFWLYRVLVLYFIMMHLVCNDTHTLQMSRPVSQTKTSIFTWF